MKALSPLTLVPASVTLLLIGCSLVGQNNPIDVTRISPQQWAALTLKGEVLDVTVKDQPVVKFKVTDTAGHPIVGLGSTMKRTADALASYPNVAFTLAKLVPGQDGSPSKWVNYLVTTTPTVAVPSPTVGRFPGTDNVGKLVDNKDGTYQYTFYRDVSKAKDLIATTKDTDTYKKADLGDLTFDPKLTHRLAFQVSGNAPGTGTNTPTGVQTTPGVAIKSPLNVVYDFIPATGQPLTAENFHRDIAVTAQCNACHGPLNKLGFHGGSRYEVKYCVACHTDQVKVGNPEATLTEDGKGYTGTTNKINNLSPGDFPIMVHKIHMGRELTMKGYNWLNRAEGQFNKNGFPQSPANCATCHTSDTKLAANAHNWKTVPSRATCGSCHDGINWVTNKGPTIHKEGAMADDSDCASCHEAADIAKVHGY